MLFLKQTSSEELLHGLELDQMKRLEYLSVTAPVGSVMPNVYSSLIYTSKFGNWKGKERKKRKAKVRQ